MGSAKIVNNFSVKEGKIPSNDVAADGNTRFVKMNREFSNKIHKRYSFLLTASGVGNIITRASCEQNNYDVFVLR